ncbi:MAG: hypothetical protein QF578_12775 [Alphaproteobacteria bacterium]|jgi:ferredoxin-type protein NapF|nr:hypothetical protein [Alphaproteobacteria bacterium]MDP6565693.1 hypothetical protein [Alphaproteobacteria bacterium]MDP6815795.1 hypothetical protein [Alphaproteobacteria bacterium]
MVDEQDIGRRDFFKLGAGRAIEAIDRGVAGRAPGWIRPPFAVAEELFLSRCSRCDDCLAACPHQVLFKLGSDREPRAAGTPAMDLLHRGCRMCRDWPCAAACAEAALIPPAAADDTPPDPPKLALVSINQQACLPYAGPECGACADSCPVPGALQWPDGVRPVIDPACCTGCGMCREACIVDPKAIDIGVYQPEGAAAEEG